ncbi:MAG: ABC transporter permease [Anaerolineae bacterium]|nr:ABC transporter permease [Anaerolineae bacterium]
MNLRKTLNVAWEGLMANKIRSFLTTLGVIIGVAAVIIMLAISAGAEAEIADQINALGANLIMVMPSFQRGGFGRGARPATLTYDDLAILESNLTHISGISAEQTTTQDVTVESVTITDVTINGTTDGFPAVRELDVAYGRFIADQDTDNLNKVAVLGYDVATELFGDPSGAVGKAIKIGSKQHVVIGVMAPKGTVGNTDYDAQVYIPITVVFKSFVATRFGSDELRMIYVSAANREEMDDVMAQLNTWLVRILETSYDSPGFTLMTQDNIIDTQASTTETFRNLLAWVAAVSLVVGGIGIMNIMLVSVSERTREIGLRQALGARQRDVRLQFLLEAVMLSLLGGLVGVVFGIGGSVLFNALGSMRTELVPLSVPLSFGAAAIIGIFFGYYPANQAAQLDPIVALRHE